MLLLRRPRLRRLMARRRPVRSAGAGWRHADAAVGIRSAVRGGVRPGAIVRRTCRTRAAATASRRERCAAVALSAAGEVGRLGALYTWDGVRMDAGEVS